MGTKKRLSKGVERSCVKANTSPLSQKKECDEQVDKALCLIGRELHDNVVQLLTCATMYLQGAGLHTGDSRLNEAATLIKKATKEIRQLSHDLIFTMSEEFSLKDTLHELYYSATKCIGFHVAIDVKNFRENFVSKQLRFCLLRISQEQFTNIIKHAQARNISLHLSANEERVKLIIKDDGVGFDPSKTHCGAGHNNIKSRVQHFHGKMKLISSPRMGTELHVAFPLGI